MVDLAKIRRKAKEEVRPAKRSPPSLRRGDGRSSRCGCGAAARAAKAMVSEGAAAVAEATEVSRPDQPAVAGSQPTQRRAAFANSKLERSSEQAGKRRQVEDSRSRRSEERGYC